MNFTARANELARLILDGVDPTELLKGTRDEEKEHDMPPAKAKKTARQHLTRVDPKYYTKTERCLGEDEVPCPDCHTQQTGRRKSLADLGWRQTGFSTESVWTNPPGTYFVYDDIIDNLPEEEYAYIVGNTNATGPGSTPPPFAGRPRGSYSAPKGLVIGDQTTIGL